MPTMTNSHCIYTESFDSNDDSFASLDSSIASLDISLSDISSIRSSRTSRSDASSCTPPALINAPIIEIMDEDDLILLQEKQDAMTRPDHRHDDDASIFSQFSLASTLCSLAETFTSSASSTIRGCKQHARGKVVSPERFQRAVQALSVDPARMEDLLEQRGGLQALQRQLRNRGAVTNTMVQQDLHLLVQECATASWIREDV